MPIPYKVTLYGCQFKCGHRHVHNLNLIKAHERRCWLNPDNRTCKTCVHEFYNKDGAGDIYGDGRFVEPDFYVRACEADYETADLMIEAIYDNLAIENPDNPNLYGIQIPPVTDCPFWEQSVSAPKREEQ